MRYYETPVNVLSAVELSTAGSEDGLLDITSASA
jgi:hypothetical protein